MELKPQKEKQLQPRSQGLSSGGKMRDPGNEVEATFDQIWICEHEDVTWKPETHWNQQLIVFFSWNAGVSWKKRQGEHICEIQ